MIISSALLLAAQAASPEWAPVAITDTRTTNLYFVDRTSITATPDGSSARTFVVSGDLSLRLHFQYDCEGQRYRALEASLGSAAAAWAPVKPQSPLHNMMRLVCSAGKLDLGFGDLAVRSASPEAFAREFLARRSERK